MRALLVVVLLSACATPRAEPPTIRHASTLPAVAAARANWPERRRVEREPAVANDGAGLAEAAQVSRGRVVVTSTCGITILEPLHFAPQSIQMTPKLTASVDELAKTLVSLQADQIIELEVVGHADFVEHDAAGLALARARSIAAILQARGVTHMVAVRGEGASQPVTRDLASDRDKNRRVDIVIVRRDEK